MAEGLKDQSILSKRISENTETTKNDFNAIRSLTNDLNSLMKDFHGNAKIGGEFVRNLRVDYEETLTTTQKTLSAKMKENKILKDNTLEIEGTLDIAEKMGDKIKDTVESIPFIGKKLSEVLDLEDLGENIQKDVLDKLIKTLNDPEKKFSDAFLSPTLEIQKHLEKNVLSKLEEMSSISPQELFKASLVSSYFVFISPNFSFVVSHFLCSFSCCSCIAALYLCFSK